MYKKRRNFAVGCAFFRREGDRSLVERWRVLERQRRSRTEGATVCNKVKINGNPFEIRRLSTRIINRLRGEAAIIAA